MTTWIGVAEGGGRGRGEKEEEEEAGEEKKREGGGGGRGLTLDWAKHGTLFLFDELMWLRGKKEFRNRGYLKRGPRRLLKGTTKMEEEEVAALGKFAS